MSSPVPPRLLRSLINGGANENDVRDLKNFLTFLKSDVDALAAGSVPDGDYGDITVSGSGATWTIDNGVVSLSKIVDATGQYKIMARTSAGSGDWQELTASSNVFSILQAASYSAIKTLLGLSTTDSPQFTGIEVGNASDTTLTRSSAGRVAVEGNELALTSEVAIVQVATVQTRTQATYSPAAAGGTADITHLDLTFTPTASGNKVILHWEVMGEDNNGHVLGYIAKRNGTVMTNAQDGSSNYYSVITPVPYDANFGSTPGTQVVSIIDESCLSTSTTYRVSLIGTHATTSSSFYFNRSKNSTGGSGEESGLSSGLALEVAV